MFLPIGCHVEKKRRCDYTAEYTAEYKQLLAKQLFLTQIARAIMNSEKARFKNVKGILSYYLKEVEQKLDGKKYTGYNALLGAWPLEKPESPAVSEDGDLLRESMTRFQRLFALQTLVIWARLDISEFQNEHLFLHIVDTHADVVAEVLSPLHTLYSLDLLYPFIEDKVSSVIELCSNYLRPGPLFKRKPNPNTHDDTEDGEYTQVLADKLFLEQILEQIDIASSQPQFITGTNVSYCREMLKYYQDEVDIKLTRPMYVDVKATLGAWPLEKAESPAVPAGSDALRKMMTTFQAGFARLTLDQWWNLDTSEFEIERRFLVIRMHHASEVGRVLKDSSIVWASKIEIYKEVNKVKRMLSADPAPVVPLYRRCKECGIDLSAHPFQHGGDGGEDSLDSE